MNVSELMTENPECCTPDDSVAEAARIMQRLDVGFIPIIESQDTRRLVGCLTDRDIVVRAIAEGKDADLCTCGDVMSRDLVSCSPDDDIERCRDLMEDNQLRRVLICDEDGALRGVVAMADVARVLEEEKIGETTRAVSQPSGSAPTA
ncbi:MAG TPA: CBS domain-containing protein [Polyangia bacterium]|jgi:CBS domain-containing protein